MTDDPTDRTRAEGVRFPCPVCGARIRAPKSASGTAVDCPKCGEKLRVPDFEPDEPKAKKRSGRRRRERSAGLPPVVGKEEPVETVQPAPRASPLDHLGEYRQEEPDPPPRWTFLSGVFGIVLQPGAFGRWLCLSFGLALTGFVLVVVLSMAGAISGGGGGPPVGVAVAFFVLPLFWLGFYTFSYAAAVGMAVLDDTAAGVQRIVSWPEPMWKEWAVHLLPLVYLLALVSVPAFGLGELLRGSDIAEYRWAVVAGVMALLFPYALLASMETGTFWAPFSAVVTISLFPLWWAWLNFYVLAGLTAGLWVGSVWIGFEMLRAPFLTGIATAPILAYVLLVEARLLGRLAWRIGERGVPIDDD